MTRSKILRIALSAGILAALLLMLCRGDLFMVDDSRTLLGVLVRGDSRGRCANSDNSRAALEALT